MLIFYTQYARKPGEYIDVFDYKALRPYEHDSLGLDIWPSNTSAWIVPGTLDPRD